MALIEVVVEDEETKRYMRGLRSDLWPNAFKDAAKEIEREALREFRRTTSTWKSKPVFESLVEIGAKELTLMVGTDDPIYGYVDRGTRAHAIRPRGNYPLRFRAGYTAKTKPGFLRSFAGGTHKASAWVSKWEVWHPGNKARGFTSAIQALMDTKAHQIIDKKVDQWLKKRYV